MLGGKFGGGLGGGSGALGGGGGALGGTGDVLGGAGDVLGGGGGVLGGGRGGVLGGGRGGHNLQARQSAGPYGAARHGSIDPLGGEGGGLSLGHKAGATRERFSRERNSRERGGGGVFGNAAGGVRSSRFRAGMPVKPHALPPIGAGGLGGVSVGGAPRAPGGGVWPTAGGKAGLYGGNYGGNHSKPLGAPSYSGPYR